MKQEYRAIVEAGFILQIDDPRVVTQYGMPDPAPSIEEYRNFASLRVEAINHALAGLPEDRVRYHLCWGSWHGPHVTDVPLKGHRGYRPPGERGCLLRRSGQPPACP